MTSPSTPNALNSLGKDDQIFLGAGALAFIFSFIAFAHISIGGFGSDTISAWHGIGVLASLLLLVAIGVAGVAALAPATLNTLPVSARLVATAAAALALLFFIIRWLTLPGGDVLGHHYGYSLYWGGYVLLILNIVTIAFGYKGMRGANESMPWENRGGPATPPPPAPPAAQ